MNKAIHKSTERSQVDIPPLNGFAFWNYTINRDIIKNSLLESKCKVIVDLYIIESMTGSAMIKFSPQHPIMNGII